MRLSPFILAFVLLIATASVILPGCKKDEAAPQPPDKTRLKSLVDSVTRVYNAAAEGTKPGNYAVGSKAPLRDAIDLALQVNTGTVFIQEDVEFAYSNLRTKFKDFTSRRIPEVAAANLVAQWKFDGNANDTTGNGHTGQLRTNWISVTGTTGTDGGTLPVLTADRFNRANRAYDFNNGACMEVPFDASLNPQSISISLWVSSRNSSPDRTLVSLNRQNGYKFQLGYNFLQFSYNASNGVHDVSDSTTAVTSDQWNQVAVSYSSGNMKFYLNGALLKTVSTTGALLSLSGPVNLVIGNELPKSQYTFTAGPYLYTAANYFSGSIDDVRLYNRVLTDAEITTIYNQERTP